MATVKISALTNLSSMTDASVFPVASAGTTYKMSGTNLTTYLLNKISVGTPASPSGNGSIAYNSGTGVLTYTPAVAYSLPVATASVLGGVKVGTNISVAGDGTISWSQPLQFTNLTDITFNQSPTVTPSTGMVWWNVNQGGLEVQFDSNTSGTTCQDNFYFVKAQGGAITKGQLCYFVGTDGASGHILAQPAVSGITDGTFIMGIAAENIANGGTGYVQWSGFVTEVDNHTFTSGDILYYDPVNGGMTKTFPTTGVLVQVAAVVYSHAIHGIYEVRIVNKQRVTGSSGVAVTQTAGSVALTVDSSVVTLTGSQVLTNKTLTTPSINTSIDSASTTFSAFTTPTTLNIANGTASGTVNLASGITASGNTIALNLGANGASGSTTNIVLGSSTSGATSTTTVYGAMTVKDVRDTVYALTYASTLTPDAANGDVQTVTLTGNVTISAFNNPVSGQTISLIITQDSTGGRTLTSTMKFAGGFKTLSTAANAIDILHISYFGSTYYASLVTGYA